MVGVPGGDLEVFGAERDRDHADRTIDPRSSEGVAGEVARRDDHVGPLADPRPVLPGVVAEIAVGDVGEFPEWEDHVGQGRGQIDVLRRVQRQVDRPVALGLGPLRRERQAALRMVEEPPGPELLQDGGEGLQDEEVRIRGRSERVANPLRASGRAHEESIGARRLASGRGDHHGSLRPVDESPNPTGRARRGFGREVSPTPPIGQWESSSMPMVIARVPSPPRRTDGRIPGR